MKLDITSHDGAHEGAASSIELDDAIFGLKPRQDLIARMVRYQLGCFIDHPFRLVSFYRT